LGAGKLLGQVAKPFETFKATRYKYRFDIVTPTGREEFFHKLVVTDFGDDFGKTPIEFYYETTALKARDGRVAMKSKAVAKGRWHERSFLGGEKKLKKATAFWISRKQAHQIWESGTMTWGKNRKIIYEKKGDGFFTLQWNDTTQTYPAIEMEWKQNTKYRLLILNNLNNPLILSDEYLDSFNNPCRMYLTDVTQLEAAFKQPRKVVLPTKEIEKNQKKRKANRENSNF
jgi:hypothetical protein